MTKKVELTAQIVAHTEKATLFQDGDKEVWIPFSQYEILEEYGDTAVIAVAEWLAEEKGMI